MKKISKTGKFFLLKILDFFKLLPFEFSFIITFFIFFIDFYNSESFLAIISKYFFAIILTILYLLFVYYIFNKKSFFLLKKIIKFWNYYYATESGKKYFRKQWRDILIEEIIFKYIPFLILSIFFEINIIYLILATGILFTFIHQFNNLFSLLEFFIFFATCHFFFLESHIFAVLFFPHLFRNLIIEYLIQHK